MNPSTLQVSAISEHARRLEEVARSRLKLTLAGLLETRPKASALIATIAAYLTEVEQAHVVKSERLAAFRAVPERKRCSHCKKLLPVIEFHRKAKAKDGRQEWCKGCKRAAAWPRSLR